MGVPRAMPKANRLKIRLDYIKNRARRIDISSLVERAKDVSAQHHKALPVIMVDMLWSAAFRQTAFQDYVDWDYAILSRAERETFMTHSISNHIAMEHDAEAHRGIFHDKIEFNKVFNAFLKRQWLDVREASVDEVRDFVQRAGTVIGKVPFSSAGHGVHRHTADDVTDWEGFRTRLLDEGQFLLEEVIQQHPTLAAVCAGTANTTRVTTYFDGEKTHILSMAQKFGRGQASDQQTFGGFYTMLSLDGKSMGRGYDSHDNVHATHPESGVSIPDFELPLVETVQPFFDDVARVVPDMRYIGWDIVMSEEGPVLVEGNWAAGVYENKPSVTGIRTGSRPRFQSIIGF
ncbi:putative polysaccharide biosynthesis protein [Paramicrobacterium agarici]|uniref:Putative polysaccharide biosynthesis protein n=2 Tax=Paramicrobacterium agarici TaxID=630514 RepID=A0A2A9DZ58_9MICO|nr:putative polysaccharide biosynthesis protein [Microbacterium agarici]